MALNANFQNFQDVTMIAGMPQGENLYTRKVKVMSLLRDVIIGKDEKHQMGFKYVSVNMIAQTIGTVMAEAGLAFSPQMIDIDQTDPERWLLTFDMRFICSTTGMIEHNLWFQDVFPKTPKHKAVDDKAMGKAKSYAMKYFLMATFVASAGDDPDLDADDRSQTKSGNNNPANQDNADQVNNNPKLVSIAHSFKAFKKGKYDLIEFYFNGQQKPINMTRKQLKSAFDDRGLAKAHIELIGGAKLDTVIKFAENELDNLKVQHQVNDAGYAKILKVKTYTPEADQETPEPEAPKVEWGSPESLKLFFQYMKQRSPTLNAGDLAVLAGLPEDKAGDASIWAEAYASGKEASVAISEALHKKATPKGQGEGVSNENPLKGQLNQKKEALIKVTVTDFEYRVSGKRTPIIAKSESGNFTFYGRKLLRDLGDEWAEFVDAWETGNTYNLIDEGMPCLIFTFKGEKLLMKNLENVGTTGVFEF